MDYILLVILLYLMVKLSRLKVTWLTHCYQQYTKYLSWCFLINTWLEFGAFSLPIEHLKHGWNILYLGLTNLYTINVSFYMYIPSWAKDCFLVILLKIAFYETASSLLTIYLLKRYYINKDLYVIPIYHSIISIMHNKKVLKDPFAHICL